MNIISDRQIESAIREWMANEQRKAGMTRHISRVTWWVWVIFLIPSDVGLSCTLAEMRGAMRRRFGGLREDAIAGGWETTESMKHETWWQGDDCH